MHNTIDQNRLRQIVFLLLITGLGVLLFIELYTFLPAALGAATLYILLRKSMFYLSEKKKWRPGAAALLLMFVSLILILLPIWMLVDMLYDKVTYAVSHANEWIVAIKETIADFELRYKVELLSDENIARIGNTISTAVPQILGATFNGLTAIFFMYFILYFMFVSGREMEKVLYDYIPLQDRNVERLEKEIHTMVVSNAIGIPVVAVAQGVVGLFGYWLIGVDEPLFWFGVTCIAGMIPVIGAALAYIPLTVMFLADGDIGQGIAMAIYGFGIIGTVDNVLRFSLLRKIGDVHPLTTVFGVIIGLNLFGFIGLIFGPLLISLFNLLLRIYSSEFLSRQRGV
ncbi:MAG: AI-2E family transporter [Bacteroidota bacterium]|jgi:predicted PurR-regulated permease PerM